MPTSIGQLLGRAWSWCSRTRKDPGGAIPRGTAYVSLEDHDLAEAHQPSEIIVPISTYVQAMRPAMTKRRWRRWRAKVREDTRAGVQARRPVL